MAEKDHSCACHTSVYAACDYPGGCGSTGGCCSTQPAGKCPTCAVYRPDADPRIPNYPPVCDGDRALLDRHLVDIANLVADLTNDETPIVDDRQHERFGTAYLPDGHRHTFSRGMRPSDPVGALGGVAPIPSKSAQPSVTGSRERPIPINVSRLDLNAPAKVPSLAPSRRGEKVETNGGWPEDQIGHLAVASTLDQWVRDWRDTLWPDQHLPAATVDELILWLRNRVQDACDRHPAIVEFAEEVRTIRSALRGAAGEIEPPPERCDGVPCKRCDLMTLFKQTDADVHCVNPDCQAVLREDEYLEWVKTLAAEARIKSKAA